MIKTAAILGRDGAIFVSSTNLPRISVFSSYFDFSGASTCGVQFRFVNCLLRPLVVDFVLHSATFVASILWC